MNVGGEKRLDAPVLFADLRGFVRLTSAMKGERAVRLLDDFFSAIADVAVAQRAVIETLTPDGILLLHGVPRPRRDDAVRAVRTALEMQRTILTLRNKWTRAGAERVRGAALAVGVATGELRVARLDPGGGRDHGAQGPPLERAVQLSFAAKPGQVLVDEATFMAAAPALGSEVTWRSEKRRAGFPPSGCVYRCQRRKADLHAVAKSWRVDPVCRARVDPSRAVKRAFAGRAYHFCSLECARRFGDEPASFVTEPS